MRVMRVAMLALVLLSVTRDARADELAPRDRATALVTAQIAAVDDPAALLATLAPDAIVLGNGAVAVASDAGAAAVLATLGRSRTGLPVLQGNITRLDAGGSGAAVWLDADLVLFHTFHGVRGGSDVTRARLSEMIVADGARWKVVALAFTSTAGVAPADDALPAPSGGPLTELVAEPSHLAEALLDDDATVALSTFAVGLGPTAARELLAHLGDGDLVLTTALEVGAPSWRYLAGELTLTPKAFWEPAAHLRVLVLAIPDTSGRWHVALVHAMAR